MPAILFRQLFDHDTCTYTYLVADPATLAGAIIDPVKKQVQRDLNLISELGIQLNYILETHVHADHITGASDIRQATGARIGIGAAAGVACADLQLADGQELPLGNHAIRVLATPGHTAGCSSYVLGERVFTGDALFIRSTGRSDFQGGSPEDQWESITKKLFSLPDATLVYPAHDYTGLTVTTIGEEKRLNQRVGQGMTRSKFVALVSSLNKPKPKRMDMAVPANLRCGKTEEA